MKSFAPVSFVPIVLKIFIRISFKLILALILLPEIVQAQNRTFYVDDDTCPSMGSGSISNPFCSVKAAFDNLDLEPGDEIIVKPGFYPQGARPGSNDSGASGNPVVVRCETGETGWKHDDPVGDCQIGDAPNTLVQAGWKNCAGSGPKPPQCNECSGGCGNVWFQDYLGQGIPASVTEVRSHESTHAGGHRMEDNGAGAINDEKGIPVNFIVYKNGNYCYRTDEVRELNNDDQHVNQKCKRRTL